MRLVAASACSLALVGCGGSPGGGETAPPAPRERPVPPRPLAAGPRLVERAPGWVRAFCDEVVRRSELRCPGTVPSGFERLDLPQERPTRRRFVLLGVTQRDGWQIQGDVRRDGPPLAAARIGPAAGDSLVLRWSHYVIHVRGEDEPRLRRQLRAVARGMTRG